MHEMRLHKTFLHVGSPIWLRAFFAPSLGQMWTSGYSSTIATGTEDVTVEMPSIDSVSSTPAHAHALTQPIHRVCSGCVRQNIVEGDNKVPPADSSTTGAGPAAQVIGPCFRTDFHSV